MPSSKQKLFLPSGVGFDIVSSGRCPLCGGQNAEFGSKGSAGIVQGWCPACTNVRISYAAIEEVKRRDQQYLLSAALRRLPADRWNEAIGDVIDPPALDKLVEPLTELSVLDQFDATLRAICEGCPIVGQRSTFSYQEDWPLVTARHPDSVLYILRQLAQMEYIERGPGGTALIPCLPTWKGYERLQQIQTSGKNSQSGFVAMSFQPSRDSVWKNIIEPGIIAAGYRPIRVDKYEHSNRIDDEIIAQIRRCRFLVADFTLQRNGVYFEAGFAQGLGRNVIFMCDESDKGNLHFDTRQFNHIFYGDMSEGREALTHRIVALEGQGLLSGND